MYIWCDIWYLYVYWDRLIEFLFFQTTESKVRDFRLKNVILCEVWTRMRYEHTWGMNTHEVWTRMRYELHAYKWLRNRSNRNNMASETTCYQSMYRNNMLSETSCYLCKSKSNCQGKIDETDTKTTPCKMISFFEDSYRKNCIHRNDFEKEWRRRDLNESVSHRHFNQWEWVSKSQTFQSMTKWQMESSIHKVYHPSMVWQMNEALIKYMIKVITHGMVWYGSWMKHW